MNRKLLYEENMDYGMSMEEFIYSSSPYTSDQSGMIALLLERYTALNQATSNPRIILCRVLLHIYSSIEASSTSTNHSPFRTRTNVPGFIDLICGPFAGLVLASVLTPT